MMISEIINAIKNGKMPRMTVSILVLPTAEATNKFTPNGGVI